MISPATAIILALTVNRQMAGRSNADYAPFMYNEESKWLLKHWLLICCYQVQAINTKTDPFGLSIKHNQDVANVLGVTIPEDCQHFKSKFGGRLAAVWLEKLAISAKDDHEDLLCEYARRCYEAALGNTEVHKFAEQVWLERLWQMLDEAALKN